jgi:hypothetical protein
MQQRKTLACIDDDSRKQMIDKAREIIYKKNYAVDTDAVEEILKESSLVPNLVSHQDTFHKVASDSFLAERIYAEAWSAWLQLL